MSKKLHELWLEHAADDLRSAEVLLEAGVFSMVCFHAQQAMEKTLKALLAAARHPIPRIHNLIRLRQMVEEAISASLELDQEGLLFLNDVYLDSRYPTDLGLFPSGLPDVEDARRAYHYADDMWHQLTGRLHELIGPRN
jgi:HEPN domain-containing protein